MDDNSTVLAVRRFEVFQPSEKCNFVDCPNPEINFLRSMKVLAQINGACPHVARVVDFCINDASVEGGSRSVLGGNVFMEYAGSTSVCHYFLGCPPDIELNEDALNHRGWKMVDDSNESDMETETESSSSTRDVPKRKISANVFLAWIKQLFLQVAPSLARRGVVIQDLAANHVFLPDVIPGCDVTANSSRVHIIDSSAYIPAYFFGPHLSASEVTAINIYMITCQFFTTLFSIQDNNKGSAVFYEAEREVIHFIYRRLFGFTQSLRIPSLGVFGNDMRWIAARTLDAAHTMMDIEKTKRFIWPSEADRTPTSHMPHHTWPHFKKEFHEIPMVRWARHYTRHPDPCAAPQFQNLDWLSIDKDNSTEVFAICSFIPDGAHRCINIAGFPQPPPCDFFENDAQFFM